MQYQKLAEIYERLENTSKRLEKTFILYRFLRECKREDIREIIYAIKKLDKQVHIQYSK